ncbi:type II secretion system F family protein [Candidatus Pacearchaeota archaeon]|nr:type II secretion system F family protein [Candidatus Pacearchaeota archaeon]
MRLKKMHWIGIIFSVIIAGTDLIFFLNDPNLFLFLFGIALGIVALPFIIGLVLENQREEEVAAMFLEFSRNLAESVATGTPISKSIINMSRKNYGPLNLFIAKLANQIALGIPVNEALQNFSYDVDSPVINRAITLISEAERAGGEIDYILESSAKAISEVEKLKKERKAAIYNLVVQGYIIFFIFIGIMLVMEFKILPLTEGIQGIGGLNIQSLSSVPDASAASATSAITAQDLARPFLYLLLSQGFFAGLTIGKITEGTIKAGIKHSFILTIAAFLISTGAEASRNFF